MCESYLIFYELGVPKPYPEKDERMEAGCRSLPVLLFVNLFGILIPQKN